MFPFQGNGSGPIPDGSITHFLMRRPHSSVDRALDFGSRCRRFESYCGRVHRTTVWCFFRTQKAPGGHDLKNNDLATREIREKPRLIVEFLIIAPNGATVGGSTVVL